MKTVSAPLTQEAIQVLKAHPALYNRLSTEKTLAKVAMRLGAIAAQTTDEVRLQLLAKGERPDRAYQTGLEVARDQMRDQVRQVAGPEEGESPVESPSLPWIPATSKYRLKAVPKSR